MVLPAPWHSAETRPNFGNERSGPPTKASSLPSRHAGSSGGKTERQQVAISFDARQRISNALLKQLAVNNFSTARRLVEEILTMRILLIDNNLRDAKARINFLTAERFIVEHADTGENALDLLKHYEFDLVLLNFNLPDMDCSLLISRSRAAGVNTPILALTSATKTQLRVKALSAGADDVVEQGIDPAELVARIRAIIRLTRGYSNARLSLCGLTLDLEKREVLADDSLVHFTAKEFDILQLLMLRKNLVLTKETILSHLYGGMDEPEMKIIDVFICKSAVSLRKSASAA